MGLRITHGCFDAPYSTFMEFRRDLCNQINIDIDGLKEYGGEGISVLDIDHDIMPLLYHSDTEGELKVSESVIIRRGLESIVTEIQVDHIYNDTPINVDFMQQIEQFIAGLTLAIDKKEIIYFK